MDPIGCGWLWPPLPFENIGSLGPPRAAEQVLEGLEAGARSLQGPGRVVSSNLQDGEALPTSMKLEMSRQPTPFDNDPV
jgi:hypothetical protein